VAAPRARPARVTTERPERPAAVAEVVERPVAVEVTTPMAVPTNGVAQTVPTNGVPRSVPKKAIVPKHRKPDLVKPA
jgi:hypothetical protein